MSYDACSSIRHFELPHEAPAQLKAVNFRTSTDTQGLFGAKC